MNRLMTGWMDGWMDVSMLELVDGWLWMDRRMDEWVMDGCMNRLMVGWVDGSMDG